jgi:hypothetical protein
MPCPPVLAKDKHTHLFFWNMNEQEKKFHNLVTSSKTPLAEAPAP